MEELINNVNFLSISKKNNKKKYYVFFDIYTINDILKKYNIKNNNLTQIFKPKILLNYKNLLNINTKITVIITDIIMSKKQDFICAKIILPNNIESFYEPSFIILFIKDNLKYIELKNYNILCNVNCEIEGIIKLNAKNYANDNFIL